MNDGTGEALARCYTQGVTSPRYKVEAKVLGCRARESERVIVLMNFRTTQPEGREGPLLSLGVC